MRTLLPSETSSHRGIISHRIENPERRTQLGINRSSRMVIRRECIRMSRRKSFETSKRAEEPSLRDQHERRKQEMFIWRMIDVHSHWRSFLLPRKKQGSRCC